MIDEDDDWIEDSEEDDWPDDEEDNPSHNFPFFY